MAVGPGRLAVVPFSRIVAVAWAVAMAVLWGPATPAAAPQADQSADGRDPVGQALHAMYNLDFAGATRILDAHLAAQPSDALGYGARATVLVFEEYQRLQILELEFFGTDDRVTGTLRVKADAKARNRIMAATAEARRLARLTLKRSPSDRPALMAMGMAVGMELHYAAIVEHRYIRTATLSRESQALADRALAISPPIIDAYVVLGSIEYVVASLNPFYRFVARVFGLRADKAMAIDHLRLVTAKGQYFAPFAKVLLAVVYLRDDQFKEARALMEELRCEFPGNPLYAREIARLDAKIGGRKIG